MRTTMAPLLLLLGAACLWGNTYYVDGSLTGASDQNPGSSVLPWKTIQKAADTVQPGDTVLVYSGVYQEAVVMQTSGTSDLPIVFRSSGPTPAVIDGSSNPSAEKLVDWNLPPKNYITLDGLEVRNSMGWGIWIRGDHNTVINCLIHDNGLTGTFSASGLIVEQGDYNRIAYSTVYSNLWNGIDFQNANYSRIDHNIVYGNLNHNGVNVFSDTATFYGMMQGNDIDHNTIYANAESGIYTRYQQHNEIANNLIYDNQQWGILLHQGGVGAPTTYDGYTTIYNNTIADNGYDGIHIRSANYVTVLNNVFSRNNQSGAQKAQLRVEQTTGHRIDYNLYELGPGSAVYWSGVWELTLAQFQQLDGGAYAQHSQQADPRFVARAVHDYRLELDSPAIDAGTALGLRRAGTDMDGTARPQGAAFDQGAFEFSQFPPPPPPSPQGPGQPPRNLRLQVP